VSKRWKMSIPKTALMSCWLLSAMEVPNAQMPNVSPAGAHSHSVNLRSVFINLWFSPTD
jgi:hypothetical protein